MNFPLHFTSPLLLLATLALLGGCSTNLFGSRHVTVDTGPIVEGHPLILPPDYTLRPPRQTADYEASLPKEHFGARKVVVGQRTVRDETRVTSVTVVAVSESTLATAPAVGSVPVAMVSSTNFVAPLSTTPAGLDANVGGATAVSGTDDMQTAIARDTAQVKADDSGFFHKYFGWMVPGHSKK